MDVWLYSGTQHSRCVPPCHWNNALKAPNRLRKNNISRLSSMSSPSDLPSFPPPVRPSVQVHRHCRHRHRGLFIYLFLFLGSSLCKNMFQEGIKISLIGCHFMKRFHQPRCFRFSFFSFIVVVVGRGLQIAGGI